MQKKRLWDLLKCLKFSFIIKYFNVANKLWKIVEKVQICYATYKSIYLRTAQMLKILSLYLENANRLRIILFHLYQNINELC